MMYPSLKSVALVLFVAAAVNVSVATAAPVVVAGDSIVFSDAPGNTGGGEFSLKVNNTWSFISFCLQVSQYMDFSHTFTVDAVSPYVVTEGVDRGGNGSGRDYLSAETAFLYTRFREGTLASYDYLGAGRASSADTLQNAIWMFEQEVRMDASNYYVVLANAAVSSGAWSGIGEVRALNLSLNGAEAQDQLALAEVPEPASLTLLGTGLLGLAWRIRRGHKRTV